MYTCTQAHNQLFNKQKFYIMLMNLDAQSKPEIIIKNLHVLNWLSSCILHKLSQKQLQKIYMQQNTQRQKFILKNQIVSLIICQNNDHHPPNFLIYLSNTTIKSVLLITLSALLLLVQNIYSCIPQLSKIIIPPKIQTDLPFSSKHILQLNPLCFVVLSQIILVYRQNCIIRKILLNLVYTDANITYAHYQQQVTNFMLQCSKFALKLEHFYERFRNKLCIFLVELIKTIMKNHCIFLHFFQMHKTSFNNTNTLSQIKCRTPQRAESCNPGQHYSNILKHLTVCWGKSSFQKEQFKISLNQLETQSLKLECFEMCRGICV
eukprot:TRINITY_DN535_c0_g1_i5.p1 TRINITY_DN535_c0_g1~~TRINITY_DN535_c0_g1_i5.p1  ORF type:complete len:320 (+),score=-14.43 TRINITY_DN535_c0_g1_i5:1413-2372(+)